MKGLASTLRTGGSLAVLLWAGSVSMTAHAASFHCSASSSYSEKAVCGNVYLSYLDDKLNASYKEALNVTPDRQSLEDARTQQWHWRQANCKNEACVTDWYERRISELDADVVQGKKAQRVAFEQHLDDQKLAPDAVSAIRDMKLGHADIKSASLAQAHPATVNTVAASTRPATPRTEQSANFTLDKVAVHHSITKETEASATPKVDGNPAVSVKDKQAKVGTPATIAKVSATSVTEMMKPVLVASHGAAPGEGVKPIPNVVTSAAK